MGARVASTESIPAGLTHQRVHELFSYLTLTRTLVAGVYVDPDHEPALGFRRFDG